MSGEPRAEAGPQIAPEDAARANLYALIGRLFYDAPDSILLAKISREQDASGEEGGTIGETWRALRAAARRAYPAMLKQEYDGLFVGVGKAEVTPYTSHYISEYSPERHLVRLREQLALWGLARRSAAYEVEDHVSGICDVMRLLIVEGRDDDEQRLFFKEFVYPAVVPLLAAVRGSASAVFYRQVAEFARAFIEVEQAAFEIEAS